MSNFVDNSLFLKPQPDEGAGATFTAAFKDGWAHNLGGQAYRAAKYTHLDYNSTNIITEEEFNEKYSLGGKLKWKPGYSIERAQAMMEDHVNDQINSSKIHEDHAVSSTVGSITGGILNPVDLLAGFLMPQVKVFSSGVRVSASAGRQAAARVGNYAVSGALEASAISGPALLALSDQTQWDYSAEEYLFDVMGGVVLGGVIGSGSAAYSHLSPSVSSQMSDMAAHAAVNGDTVMPRAASAAAAKDPSAADHVDFMARAESRGATQVVEEYYRRITGREMPRVVEDITKLSRRGLFLMNRLKPSDLRQVENMGARERGRRLTEQSYTPKTDDEKLLADIFHKLFGANVRYFSETTSKQLNVVGMTRGADPNTVFVRSGKLEGGPDSMLEVAGHELGHSIKFRDPSLWRSVTDAMAVAGSGDNPDPEIAAAYKYVSRLANTRRPRSAWSNMGLDTKLDEVFATTFGRAMRSKKFWASMRLWHPTGFNRLIDSVLDLESRARDIKSTKSQQLADELARIVSIAGDGGHISEKQGRAKKAPFRYADRHRRMLRDLQRRVDTSTKDQDPRLRQDIDRFIEEITAPIWSLRDRTGESSTVYKVKPGKMNVRHFIKEQRQRYLDLKEQGKLDELSPQERGLLERWVERGEGKGQPLLIFNPKRNADGSYNVRVFRDVDDTRLIERAEPDIDTSQNQSSVFDGEEPDTRTEGLLEVTTLKEVDDGLMIPVIDEELFVANQLDNMEDLGSSADADLRSRIEQEQNEAIYDYQERLGVLLKDEPNPDAALRKLRASIVADLNAEIDGLLDAAYVGSREARELLKSRKDSDPKGVQQDLETMADEIMAGFLSSGYNQLLGKKSSQDILNKGDFSSLDANPAVLDTISDPTSTAAIDDISWAARGPDEGPDQHRARMDKEVDDHRAEPIRRVKREAATAEARQTKERQPLARWLTNHAATVKEVINKSLSKEEFQYETDYTKPKAENKKVEGDTETEIPLPVWLEKIDEQARSEHGTIDSLERGTILSDEVGKDTRLGQDIDYWTIRGLTGEDLYSQLRADSTRRAHNEIQQYYLNKQAKSKLGSIFRAGGWNKLKSFLDGVARSGVARPGMLDSVDGHRRALIDNDVAAMDVVLKELGLHREWMQNGPIVRKTFEEMAGMDTGNPAAKRLAKVLGDTNAIGAGRLNQLGANIHLLDGFVMSQIHNKRLFLRTGQETFIRDVMEMLDWDQTHPELKTVKERQNFLSQFYHEVTKSELGNYRDYDPVTDGGNIASMVSRRRTLHFKPGAIFDYDMKYGSGNTGSNIFTQITKRAERAAIMQAFGTDYKATWNSLMDNIKPPEGSKAETRYDAWAANNSFKHLTGELDRVENQDIAAWGDGARKAANMIVGWMSTVSSVTDFSHAVSTAKWMGVPANKAVPAILSSMKKNFRRNSDNWQTLEGMGVGLNSLFSAVNRATLQDTAMQRFLTRGSDAVFRLNGQQAWNRIVQTAWLDVTTQHIGMEAVSGRVSPPFKNWLESYGITTDEWKRMTKYAAEIEGLEGPRLVPDLIDDPVLSQKLRTALRDSMDYAVLQPSLSDNALLRAGTQAGTKSGEALRTIMQYKSYVLAMLSKADRRFQHAYGGEYWDESAYFTRAQKERMIWTASLLGLGALATSVKDMLRGREPFNPADEDQWSGSNIARIAAQAGLGPIAMIDQFSSPEQALGPTAGILFNAGEALTSDSSYTRLSSTLGIMPGASIAPINEASKAILSQLFGEATAASYQSMLARIELERGTSSLYQD